LAVADQRANRADRTLSLLFGCESDAATGGDCLPSVGANAPVFAWSVAASRDRGASSGLAAVAGGDDPGLVGEDDGLDAVA
jgi:hypothetical protein